MSSTTNILTEIPKGHYLGHFQMGNAKCSDIGYKWRACADRVGMIHTPEKCTAVFEDYQECLYNIKYKKRVRAMRMQMLMQNKSPPKIPDHAL